MANCCHLLCFVRQICGSEVKDVFVYLFCYPLKTTAKACDLFKPVDEPFTDNGLSWSIAGSICTDGTPAMIGHNSIFAALVKKCVPDILTIHCTIHRCALASETLHATLLARVFKNVLYLFVRPTTNWQMILMTPLLLPDWHTLQICFTSK